MRDVKGTLRFKADGTYEQNLYVGDILNAIKGTYRVAGKRLETTYQWQGAAVTDAFDLHLDPAGKLLTLTGSKTYYTLERMD